MASSVVRRLGPGAAVALVMLVVVGPLVPVATAQPLVRYAQSAALVEHRSLELDAYRGTLLVDRVELDGHVYSDKAPLQAFAAAPVYAVGRVLGFESASVNRPRQNLGLWWLTLWCATLPGAALVVLMHRSARRVAPSGATVATVGMAFGTLLLPFSGQLYGHVLSALLVYGSWMVVHNAARSPRQLALAGALAGGAVAIEYPTALVAGVVAVAIVVMRGWRALVPFALGALPFGAFLAWYHWAAFGGPFTDPYRLKPQHAGASAAVTGLPDLRQGVEVLLGARGLWLFAPVTALGLAGLVVLLRRGDDKPTAVVGIAAFLVLWLLQAGWSNPWGGEMPGPRYMIPSLPFLAAGLAVAVERWPVVVRVATAWGVVAMAGPLLTVHLVLGDGITGAAHVANFRRWGASPALPVLAWGRVGWLLYGAAVTVTVVAMVRLIDAHRSPSGLQLSSPEPASEVDRT